MTNSMVLIGSSENQINLIALRLTSGQKNSAHMIVDSRARHGKIISTMNWNDSIARYCEYYPEDGVSGGGRGVRKFVDFYVDNLTLLEFSLQIFKYLFFSVVFSFGFFFASGVLTDVDFTNASKYFSFIFAALLSTFTVFLLIRRSIKSGGDLFQSIVYFTSALILSMEIILLFISIF